jgi:hypothetical protein
VRARDFYVKRAAECVLVADRVSESSHRETLMHMAAAYVRRAIEIELQQARAQEISAPPLEEPGGRELGAV